MKIISLLITISVLTLGCLFAGFFGQASNSNSIGSETEIGNQKTNLSSLHNNEQLMQAKLSKQMLSNKAQINRVEQQLTQLTKTLNQLTLAQENDLDHVSQPDVTEEDIIPGVTIEEPVEDRQFVDHFANYLASEATSLDDEQESILKIEQSFEAALESKRMTGVNLVYSECKATLCKIELSFADENARDRYSNLGVSIIPWDGQAFFHQSETEPNIMIYYVAKEGFDLAMPESIDG